MDKHKKRWARIVAAVWAVLHMLLVTELIYENADIPSRLLRSAIVGLAGAVVYMVTVWILESWIRKI